MISWSQRLLFLMMAGLSAGLIMACQPGRVQPEDVTIEAGPPRTDEEFARQALIVFFAQLQAGEYELAVDLYGGSYDVLTGFNPNVEPSDRATLWRNGCSINSLNCLVTRTVTLAGRPSVNEYIFDVEFSTREGDLFVLGPCCGATETEQPPVSRFPIRVVKGSDGFFRVIDLPPYIP
jgi:hypothetical protein